MKTVLICFLVLLTLSVRAQNFEGTIKWAMNMDISDPATKAKIAEAQKKMSSPEQQEKMKQMKEKMNDPQFKAMMDANPQMKAQMENMMKAAGGDASAMTPAGFTVKIKGDNSLTKIEGGPMPMEMLYLTDKAQTFMLNRTEKTYSPLPTGGRSGQSQTGTTPNPAKVTKTSETMKILGYNCTKYLVEITERGRTLNQVIWTTTEFKGLDYKKFSKAKVGQGTSMFYEGMDGVPMRIESSTPEGKMTMEVKELKAESLPASDFVIPTDWKETSFMGGMMGR